LGIKILGLDSYHVKVQTIVFKSYKEKPIGKADWFFHLK